MAFTKGFAKIKLFDNQVNLELKGTLEFAYLAPCPLHLSVCLSVHATGCMLVRCTVCVCVRVLVHMGACLSVCVCVCVHLRPLSLQDIVAAHIRTMSHPRSHRDWFWSDA